MTSQPQNIPQSQVSDEVRHLRAARLYLRTMLASETPIKINQPVGEWHYTCVKIHAAHIAGGRNGARNAFADLCKDDPILMAVVSGESEAIQAPKKRFLVYSVAEMLVACDAGAYDDEKEEEERFDDEDYDEDDEEEEEEDDDEEGEESYDEDEAVATSPAPEPSPTVATVVASVPVSVPVLASGTSDELSLSLAFKPLPAKVARPVEEGADASPWLDGYIAFSKKWSPRGYEGFHEAVGVWVLSTVAARRVMVPLGEKYYTPMFIVLVGRTGLFAKSTTAKIGRAVLSAAGVDWLLAPDDATPQKFISEMAGRLTANYATLSMMDQDAVKQTLAFSGQRGWFYDEFGQIMNSILRDGIMSDFRGILRRLDDCYARYAYATISRGTEVVQNPYLALLGSMTPHDLGKAAKSGSSLWGDGFLARFAFVTPPVGSSAKGRFPEGLREVPDALSAPLRAWHTRLGIPEISVEPVFNKKGEETGDYAFSRGELPECTCTFAPGVIDAYYTYSEALVELRASSTTNHDLDGSYNRFASKALRIAMLLASLENDGCIEMRHWARGQVISERWRANLHELFAQANEAPIKDDEIMEERILQVVSKLKLATVREIKQYIHGIDTPQLRQKVQDLVGAETLEEVKCGKALRYRFFSPEASKQV